LEQVGQEWQQTQPQLLPKDQTLCSLALLLKAAVAAVATTITSRVQHLEVMVDRVEELGAIIHHRVSLSQEQEFLGKVIAVALVETIQLPMVRALVEVVVLAQLALQA
jgi:hypothetical protein